MSGENDPASFQRLHMPSICQHHRKTSRTRNEIRMSDTKQAVQGLTHVPSLSPWSGLFVGNAGRSPHAVVHSETGSEYEYVGTCKSFNYVENVLGRHEGSGTCTQTCFTLIKVIRWEIAASSRGPLRPSCDIIRNKTAAKRGKNAFSCLAVPTMNDNIDSASAKKHYIMFLMSFAVDPPLTCQNDKSPNVRLDLVSLLPFLCAFCLSGCEGNTSVFHMEMYDGASKNRMIKLNIFLRRYEFCSAFLSSGNFSPSSSSPHSCGCAPARLLMKSISSSC